MSLKSSKSSPTKKKARIDRQGVNHPIHNHTITNTRLQLQGNVQRTETSNICAGNYMSIANTKDCMMISGLSPSAKQHENGVINLHKVQSAYSKAPTKPLNDPDPDGTHASVRNRVSLSMHGTHTVLQHTRGNLNNHGNSSKHCTARVVPIVGGLFATDRPAIEHAKGEGNEQLVQSRHNKEQMAWQAEMGTTPTAPNSIQQAVVLKNSPSSSYRTVLAKRGLLVRDTLGSGSYSKVKHAQYIRPVDVLHPPVYPANVAVKIIDRAVAPSDFQQKFLPRELQIWPHLSHPNIVKMLECFTESHRVYMILEFVEGGDALRFIQNSGAVSETTGRIWTRQVAEAVKYLHDLDITHRDLKLENMLIDSTNNIKICDFGFVKQCTERDLSKTFCGSKSYAAPEILKGEPYPPKKADVWAVGVILFILVTARMPFDETKGNSSLLEEHRRLDLQWPRGRRGVSTQCKALSLYCLSYPWLERPSIHQVLAHSWFKIQPNLTGTRC